jgi:hypothetical protein
MARARLSRADLPEALNLGGIFVVAPLASICAKVPISTVKSGELRSARAGLLLPGPLDRAEHLRMFFSQACCSPRRRSRPPWYKPKRDTLPLPLGVPNDKAAN